MAAAGVERSVFLSFISLTVIVSSIYVESHPLQIGGNGITQNVTEFLRLWDDAPQDFVNILSNPILHICHHDYNRSLTCPVGKSGRRDKIRSASPFRYCINEDQRR